MGIFEKLHNRINKTIKNVSTRKESIDTTMVYSENDQIELLLRAIADNSTDSAQKIAVNILSEIKGDRLSEVCGLIHNLAMQELQNGHPFITVVLLNSLIPFVRSLDSPERMCLVLCNLGIAYRATGNFEFSYKYLHEAYEIICQGNLPSPYPENTVAQLSLTAVPFMLTSPSNVSQTEARHIFNLAWNVRGILHPSLVKDLFETGIYLFKFIADAKEELQFALNGVENIGDGIDLADMPKRWQFVGDAALRARDYLTAFNAYQKSIDLLKERGKIESPELLLGMAEASRWLGSSTPEQSLNREKSISLLNQAMYLNPKKDIALSILTKLSAIQLELNHDNDAIETCRRAVVLIGDDGQPENRALVLHNLGASLIKTEQDHEGIPLLESALDLRRSLHDMRGSADTLYMLSIAKSMDNSKAIKIGMEALSLYRECCADKREMECIEQLFKLVLSCDTNTYLLKLSEWENRLRELHAPAWYMILCLYRKALYCFKAHHLKEALTSVFESINIAVSIDAQAIMLAETALIGGILLTSRQFEAARSIFKCLIFNIDIQSSIDSTSISPHDKVVSYLGLGICSLFCDELDTADIYLTKAVGIIEENHETATSPNVMKSLRQEQLDIIKAIIMPFINSNKLFYNSDIPEELIDLVVNTDGIRILSLNTSMSWFDTRYAMRVYRTLAEVIQIRNKKYIDALITIERSKSLFYLSEIDSRDVHSESPWICGVWGNTSIYDTKKLFSWLENTPRTAIMNFYCGKNSGGVWIVTSPTDINFFSLPKLSQKELTEVMLKRWTEPYNAFKQAIMMPSKSYTVSTLALETLKTEMNVLLRFLHEIIFKEISDQMEKLLGEYQVKTLVIVPYGLLHHLPIHAAMNEKGEYLCDKFDVVFSPSIAIIKRNLKLKRSWGPNLLLVSNPDGSLRGDDFERQLLSNLFSEAYILGPGKATRKETLLKLRECNVAHFSCHAYLSENKISESGLVLSNNERLTVEDLIPPGRTYYKKPYGKQLKLVFLAACETGATILHMSQIEEIIHLATGFMAAGTPSVISSLWTIPDDSTNLLTHHFYKAIFKQNLSIGKALHEAQRETRKKYSHPFYWAPFQLLGAWQ
jgi:CHAT domain-containing protein/tetratricopeptide (TPR) repeat protein